MFSKLIKKITNEDKKLLHEGDEYFKRGDYSSAIEYYKKALSINSNLIEADKKIKLCNDILSLIDKADNQYIKGDIEESYKLYNQILEIVKDSHSIEMISKIEKIKKLCNEINTLIENDINIDNVGNINFKMINQKLNELKYIDNNIFIENFIINTKNKIKRKFDEYFRKGINFYNLGIYSEAYDFFNIASKLNSKDKSISKYLEKTEEILKLLRDAEELFINSSYENSLVKYRKIHEINPKDENIIYEINTIEKIISLKIASYKPSKYGNINRIVSFSEIINYNPYDEYVNEVLTKDIEEYCESIKYNMNINNYIEYFKEIKKINTISVKIYIAYVEKIKRIIHNLYNTNINITTRYLKLMIHYWLVIGGNTLKKLIPLPKKYDIINIWGTQNNNTVFINCKNLENDNYELIYYDIKQCEIIWSRSMAYYITDIIVENNIAYIISNLGIISINIPTNKILWKIAIENISENKKILRENISNKLIIFDGNKNIWCINEKTGELLWEYVLEGNIELFSNSGKLLFIKTKLDGKFNNYIFNFNGLLYKCNENIISITDCDNDEIYMLTEKNKLKLLNIKTEKIKWEQQLEIKNIYLIKYIKSNGSLMLFSRNIKTKTTNNNNTYVTSMHCLNLNNMSYECSYTMGYGNVCIIEEIYNSDKPILILGTYTNTQNICSLYFIDIFRKKMLKEHRVSGEILNYNIYLNSNLIKNNLKIENIFSICYKTHSPNHIFFNEINPDLGELVTSYICHKNSLLNSIENYSNYIIEYNENKLYAYSKNRFNLSTRLCTENLLFINNILHAGLSYYLGKLERKYNTTKNKDKEEFVKLLNEAEIQLHNGKYSKVYSIIRIIKNIGKTRKLKIKETQNIIYDKNLDKINIENVKDDNDNTINEINNNVNNNVNSNVDNTDLLDLLEEDEFDDLLDKLINEKEEKDDKYEVVANENNGDEEESERDKLLKKFRIKEPDDDEIDRLLENI